MNGFVLLLIITVTASVACGSTSTRTTAGPTPVKCAVATTLSLSTFPASGGSGDLVVSSSRECSWSASSPDVWISLTPPTDGQGNGKVRYTVAPNPAASARRGTLSVGSQPNGITQDPAACQFELDPRSFDLAAGEQTASVSVRSLAGCTWAAKTAVPWIVIVDGSQGNGTGRLLFRVSSNPSNGPRSGSLELAGHRVDVRQLGGVGSGDGGGGGGGVTPCSYDVQPASADAGPEQTNGTLSVRTTAGCAWTAAPDQPWLLLVTGATGSGSADVRYQAAANSGTSSRTGHITVSGSVFSLRQAGCSYSINPTGGSFPAFGGSGRIDVQAQAPCAWAAVTQDTWILITSSSTGSGNGGLTYTLAPNTRVAARTGIITVAGQDFTVTQGGATSILGTLHSVAGSCPDKRFIVNGQRVRTTRATDYEGGSCSDIRDGATIRVKGIVGSDTVLTASEMDFM